MTKRIAENYPAIEEMRKLVEHTAKCPYCKPLFDAIYFCFKRSGDDI